MSGLAENGQGQEATRAQAPGKDVIFVSIGLKEDDPDGEIGLARHAAWLKELKARIGPANVNGTGRRAHERR